MYYGIGSDTAEANEEQYDYYQFLFEPVFLKRMFTKYLFIGGGMRLNHIYNTDIEEGGLIDMNRPEGFDGSTSVGLEVAALYDSRNNLLNASKGWYFEATYGVYDKFIGSTQNFNLTRFDLRHFMEVSRQTRDVLAFQTIGRFSRGHLPFSEYAFFGSSEIMRGYREGRFVDRDMLAAQVEYRKNFKNSRLGAVAFLGLGGIYNNEDEFQFGTLKPSYGAGLRFKIDKNENLNIRLDWGFGNGVNSVYLGIAESF